MPPADLGLTVEVFVVSRGGAPVEPRADPNARLTAAEAARMLRCDRQVVKNWIARGKLIPVDRLGPRGAPRYRRRDVLVADACARDNDSGRGRHRRDQASAA